MAGVYTRVYGPGSPACRTNNDGYAAWGVLNGINIVEASTTDWTLPPADGWAFRSAPVSTYGGSAGVVIQGIHDPCFTVTAGPNLSTTESGGAAAFSVALNYAPTADVTIGLRSSDMAEGTISPQSLVFTTANWNVPQTVTVTGVDDAVADGDKPYTIITAPATSTDSILNGRDAADVPVTNRDNDPPTLSVTLDGATVSEVAGALAATGTVTRNTPTVDALFVTLSSSDAGKVTVPATATIPAGQTSASFAVSAVDNVIVDGPVTVTITARAGGFCDGTAALRVTDNDVAALVLAVQPTTFSDASGASAATGAITRNSGLGADMVVAMASSDTGAVTVPAAVTIPAGQPSTTFPLAAVNDGLAGGDRPVTITANAAGLTATAGVIVTDSTAPALTLTASPANFSEAASDGAATGTVTRNTPTTATLTVNLASSNTGEAKLPATVTIAAGQPSATFSLDAVDDSIADGPQTVTLTASAAGFTAGTATVTVTDNETPTLGLSITPDRFRESAGAHAATGTVTRNTPAAAALIVSLSSSNTRKATVPPTVTIPAGAGSAPFSVAAVNNATADGPQRVTIRASATGFTAAQASVTVLDHEPASKFSISGQITVPTIAATGATVRQPVPAANATLLTGNVIRDILTTDVSGRYRFTNVPAGTYTLTPSRTNYTFLPASRNVTLTTADAANVDFDSVARGQISGRLTLVREEGNGGVLPGISVSLRCAQQVWTARTDALGNFLFDRLPLGTCVFMPAKLGTYWTPRWRTVTLTPAVPTVIHLDFLKAGTDAVAPTVAVTTPRPGTYTVAAQPTLTAGTARDSGGAGLAMITVAVARFASATASTPSGYYNWSTKAFGTSSTPAVTERLATGTATWTLRGLPTLPVGFYGIRATALDGASNMTPSAWVRFAITAPPLRQPVSATALSTAMATAATNTVQLKFGGALDAESASDAAHFAVTVNGRAATVESAAYNGSTHTVTLALQEGALHSGDAVMVSWSGLLDATASVLPDGRVALAAK